ncbi:MAG: HD domain-containing phosphohydrolase [Candidatus Eisenbacteria bacterium]
MIEERSLPDDEARTRDFGFDLISRLQALFRAGRLYDQKNRAFQQHLEEIRGTLARAGDEEVVLVSMGDYFYVDGVRLRARPTHLGLFRALREEFESRGLGALRILPGAGTDEWISFLRLHATAKSAESADRLPEALADSGVLRIIAVRARDIRSVVPEAAEDSNEEGSERVRAKQHFWNAARGAKTVMLRAAQTGRPAIRQVRRLVHPIVDSILKDECSIVGLTAIKEHDEYTFVHCVNVSVLAVAIGAALGLPRTTLANLGVAALLHDLGKLAVAPDVLNKPNGLTGDEWSQVERHPVEGVKMLARMSGLSPLMLDTMRVSHEHHMNMDGTGYPKPKEGARMSVLSRIVAVADVFDALTAHRAYRHRPFTGFEAMAILIGPERTHSDPAALWALVQSVGLYPAGTVMQTRSGYHVLSVSPNPRDTRRPYCRVITRPGEQRCDLGAMERWDPMPEEEQVERVVFPEEHGLPVDQLLAA